MCWSLFKTSIIVHMSVLNLKEWIFNINLNVDFDIYALTVFLEKKKLNSLIKFFEALEMHVIWFAWEQIIQRAKSLKHDKQII